MIYKKSYFVENFNTCIHVSFSSPRLNREYSQMMVLISSKDTNVAGKNCIQILVKSESHLNVFLEILC